MTTEASTRLPETKALDTELLDGAATPAPLGPDDEHEASLARQTVSGLAWTMWRGGGARVVQFAATLLPPFFVAPQARGEAPPPAALVRSAARFSGRGVSNFTPPRRNPPRDV